MEMLFIKVLNMSISASWLVLVVLALRFLLKKSPRWIHVALWALVAVRLICPVSLESVLSLIPENTTERIVESLSGGYYGDATIYSQGSEEYDAALASGITPSVGDNGYHYVLTQPDDPTIPVRTAAVFYGQVWVAGIALMILHALLSYTRLKQKVSASIHLNNGVYLCDYIETPFILGIFKPRIYLPSGMEPDSASHVLAHERAHIARRDHWWKPLGYVLLALHWFNPLLWLAYILLCRDIELACDEKVIRDMELPQKKAYSEALLRCSVNRRMIAACPLAFGEVGVKERVKTVLHYKKPAFWIVLVAIIALILTAVCFLTDPVEEQEDIFGSMYQVEKVVYGNPVLSYYMTEANAPLFKLTEGQTMQRKEDGTEWEDLGAASEIQLSAVDIDDLFLYQGVGMEEEITLVQLREDNRKAWLISGPNLETANSVEFYLLLWQESGEVYLAQGISFSNVYPLHESALDSSANVNWLFRLIPTISDSPYRWTSTVEAWDIRKAWAYPYGGASYPNSIEGNKLDELQRLLNGIEESEIVTRSPSGLNDPLWVLDGTVVTLYCNDGLSVMLQYAEGTVIISTVTDSGVWETDGYWVIENEDLKVWMQNLANGGTWMLSNENRDEIRQLLRQENVQFFDPQEYENLLFVGCAYDNGRGLGVACFEKTAYGYKLIRMIRGEDVKQCASGGDLYYCDHNNNRIFLVMNDSVTGMEFAGAYETQHSIDTHPGLVVEYYPAFLVSMYRFVYADGNATTMYMDWNNETHAQPPEYDVARFDDPDDAYRVCSTLRNSQVHYIRATEILEVDDRYSQACSHELTEAQTVELLNLLRSLPEAAYEQAELPQTDVRFVDIFLTNESGLMGGYPMLRLKIDQGTVYYQLLLDVENTSQGWKINAPALLEYLESFYGGDLSTWHRFAPFVKTEGEVIWSVDGMEITVPKVTCFEYDVSEEGIRFKPKVQEGWVLLQYRTEPYAPEELGLRRFNGMNGGKEVVRGCYGDADEWDFMDITVTSGNIACNVLLLNEEAAAWVAEYDEEVLAIIHELNILVKD